MPASNSLLRMLQLLVDRGVASQLETVHIQATMTGEEDIFASEEATNNELMDRTTAHAHLLVSENLDQKHECH